MSRTPNDCPAETRPLLTYKQAARQLGVGERTVWGLVDRGELPAVRIGRAVRIDPTDLQAFIAKAKGQNDSSQERGAN